MWAGGAVARWVVRPMKGRLLALRRAGTPGAPGRGAAVQLTPEGFLRLDGSCVAPAPPILDAESRRFNRLDAVWLAIWLVFPAGLAALPLRLEWHNQVILLPIGLVQLL